MAWQPLTYRFSSSAPLIMHNGQTADPTNKWSKAIKAISGKRAKTDADYEELARLEFLAGLYMAADGPIIPNTVIDGMTLNAAKKRKEGQIAKSGVFCLEHARLDYEGPRTGEALWAEDRFHFAANVRVSMARVVRMRPRFDTWACNVTLQIEDTLVNPSQVDEWMRIAGTQVGIGDWRPQFGRFTSKRLNGED